ncbi:MAG: ABC transporter permease [Candidatus Omnitrophota bacterium]
MSLEKIVFDYSILKTLHIKINGDWLISSELPSVHEVSLALAAHADITQITFDISQLAKWDSGLVSFLLKLIRDAESNNIKVILDSLPQGVQKLLAIALKVHERIIPAHIAREPFFARIGERTIKFSESILSLLDFLGEVAFSFWRFIRGKAYFNFDDFVLIVQKCGVNALFLVSLISMLVGMILAFVGAIQLKMFGAQIFIADIVGIAMVRVMGAVMTGVLLSGRTGASFAAELGIMQANEEIDAFKTLGVNPIEYLVMPRILALLIMMPLLTLYADFMGILGGFVISVGMLNINPVEYLHHTKNAVKLNNLWVGLVQGFVFGIIIAVSGCLRGIKCERSAAAVGEATTSAVVTAITGIVIATAIITFICQIIGV